MKRKRTNWQRFFESQMKDPEFRVRVEEEIRALRVGAQIAALRRRRKLSQTEGAHERSIRVAVHEEVVGQRAEEGLGSLSVGGNDEVDAGVGAAQVLEDA